MSSVVRKAIIIAAIVSGVMISEASGFNLINTRVYAEVNKPALGSIYLSEGDDIIFYQDVHSYIVDLDKDKEEAYIRAKPDDPSYTVKINGEIVTKDNNYKQMLKLNKGKNAVEIEVLDSQKNSSTYTVYVYRGGKEAVYLEDININGSNIGFASDCKAYNIELDEGNDLVEFEATPEDGKYQIAVKGRVLDETNSIKIKLSQIGKYTIDIGLKDLDTGRTGSYTLSIYYGIPVTPNVSDAVESVLKRNQWVIVNGRWRYNDINGKTLKDTWYYDTKYNSYFHFNSVGNMQTGWLHDGGNWYYLNPNGEMQTGWLLYENNWYYLDYDGVMRTGWIEDAGKWYFLKKDGTMAVDWIVSNGKWYFLHAGGDMKTGWLYYGKKWYLLDWDGAMLTGWVQSDNEWYYLNDDGTMKSGEWQYTDGNWYYLNLYGNMRRNIWLSVDDKYFYYLNEDGSMQTSPMTQNGYNYTFREDGSADI